jgi:hypothetical protein
MSDKLIYESAKASTFSRVDNRLVHYDPCVVDTRGNPLRRKMKSADGKLSVNVMYDRVLGALQSSDMVLYYALVSVAQRNKKRRIRFKSRYDLEKQTGLARFASSGRLFDSLWRLLHTSVSYTENGWSEHYNLLRGFGHDEEMQELLVDFNKEVLDWATMNHSTHVDHLRMQGMRSPIARKWYLKLQAFQSRINKKPLLFDLYRVSELFGMPTSSARASRLVTQHERAIEQAFPDSERTIWRVMEATRRARGQYVLTVTKTHSDK